MRQLTRWGWDAANRLSHRSCSNDKAVTTPRRSWVLVPLALAALAPGVASASPGGDAIEEYLDGRDQADAVQNRFFLKSNRFEVGPTLGYVPNNPFARRYVGGLAFTYHLSENLGLQSVFTYSPDLGEEDLKGLTSTLVEIAETGTGETQFQQPLDKVTLAASFSLVWAPFYGKINLVGETVLNFDFYGLVGAGMVSRVNYYARYECDDVNCVTLDPGPNEFAFAPNLGMGANFFGSQAFALKMEARFQFYVDNRPDYAPEDGTPVTEKRLYNNFVASIGPVFYFPKMKPRLYDF